MRGASSHQRSYSDDEQFNDGKRHDERRDDAGHGFILSAHPDPDNLRNRRAYKIPSFVTE